MNYVTLMIPVLSRRNAVLASLGLLAAVAAVAMWSSGRGVETAVVSTDQAAQEVAELDALIADMEANPDPVEFSIVPTAPTALSVPPQAVSDQASLAAAFEAARTSGVYSGARSYNLFEVPVGGVTYLEYLPSLPPEIHDPLWQMHRELREVVAIQNAANPQQSLAERAGIPELAAFLDAANDVEGNLSVYPSLNVAEAQLIGAVLEAQYPSQAVQVAAALESFIEAGIAYGHYTVEDAAVARSLADAYVALARTNAVTEPVFRSLEE